MSLQVIGSGFGRTGTMSMKEAMGVLGLDPCHHMLEVMENPSQLAHWKAILAGDPVNWADVFEGYQSQVDWPGAHVWHETSMAFPDARVIHTQRPEQDWWASFNGTIGKFFACYKELDLPPPIEDLFSTMKSLIMTLLMGGTLPILLTVARVYDERLSVVGRIYGWNIFGAAAGTLICGFFAIRLLGVTGAYYCAMALNLVVAAIAFILNTRIRGTPVEDTGPKASSTGHSSSSPALLPSHPEESYLFL